MIRYAVKLENLAVAIAVLAAPGSVFASSFVPRSLFDTLHSSFTSRHHRRAEGASVKTQARTTSINLHLMLPRRIFSTATFAKRKGAPGGASPSSSTKKIQVKLLKYVAGIGQKGDVVRVSTSVLNNVLRPSQSARVITDEELQKELAEAALRERELDRAATSVKDEIEARTLTMVRKAGPDGKLFGGIGPKVILDELKSSLGASGRFLDRGVKVISIVDSEGAKVQGDVKRVGSFGARIALTKDITAALKAEIRAES